MSFKPVLSYILATLIFCTASAQQKNDPYEAAWKNVDTLIIKKGLTASALTEVNKIYERAKKENNSAQQVKALWYRLNLQQMKEENSELKNLATLEKEITVAKDPVKAILQCLAAEGYNSFYQSRRYQLYRRTQTVNYKQDDIETWSINDFHAKISGLFLACLSNEKLLQQVKLDAFKPIIIKGNVSHLRPTLFDLLANRALGYFETGESRLNRPSEIFEIDDPAAFTDARTFVTHRFTTTDSLSLEHKALQLHQRLLQFHLNDASPDALIDEDLNRLIYVRTKSVSDNKDELYRQALERIIDRFGSQPAAAQASYLLARYYADKAGQYQPLKNDSGRYDYVKAKEICEKIIARTENSEGKTNCLSLIKEIEYQELSLKTEKANLPGQPFRALVSYRNFNRVYFRIVKLDNAMSKNLSENNSGDSYWQKVVRLPATKSFSQFLPDTKDYQRHSTEIKMDALPPGEYLFIASLNSDFELDKGPMALETFYITNISWINKGNEYFVLHRETGQPIRSASVQVIYRYYDYGARKMIERKGENIMTDKNGYFKIFPPKTTSESSYRLEVSTPGDQFSPDDYASGLVRPAQEVPKKDIISTFLFTDRGIYRPGQILYFKGITIKKNPQNKENSLVTGQKDKIYLRDANGQLLDSVELTTNDYGSYSGKFTLPTGVLNGVFSMTNSTYTAYHNFRVEEYKRPKFQVDIKKPEGTYRLNDSIKVTGNAKAYAGNNIDGATIKYRVVRRAIIPLWFYGYSRIWPPYSNVSMEIAHGQTTTDASGNFTVTFKAIPDKTTPKRAQPVFYYEVSADVTDIAGETRSGSTSVSVGYQALKLELSLPDKKHVDSLEKLNISSANLNGIFEKATVSVAIYKLKAPARLLRQRYWDQPDQYVLTQEEYYRLFPYDVYKNEDEPINWPREQKVAEVVDTTAKSGDFKFPHSRLTPGFYVVEAITKDKYGEEVKDIKYIQLFETDLVSPIMYGNIEARQPVAEPGEKVTYNISTNLDSVFVIRELSRKNNETEKAFLILNNSHASFEAPVSESDRGGLGIQIAFVKHNREFTQEYTFQVPYTNKELTIAYETFRDKTLPGSEEKWKVRITGLKGEKVAAEMLAGMYDMSLDQFYPGQNWEKPAIYDYFSFTGVWNGERNFSEVSSANRIYYNSSPLFEKTYDNLGLAISRVYGYFDWPTISRPIFMQMAKPISIRGNNNFQHDMNPDVRYSADEAKMERAPVAYEALPGDRRNYKKGDVADNLADGVDDKTDAENGAPGAAAQVQVRKNFNETAFFFPELRTDSNGAIEFSFTMPEALTQWKWMTLAHTKDLAFGYSEKTIVTQKELMVQPNAPRFLREGDRMDFSGKIVNLSDKEITGQVQLLLIDPTTNESVDGWFRNMYPNQYFTAAAGQSVPVSFSIEIPFKYNKPVTYRIVASSTTLSDGEENVLPVITNRMLVTESLPLPMRGNASKSFKFEKLLNSGKSETLDQHALTIEFTSNPAWYAVQALPYLMEYPYECAEQTFNRYYANALASAIVAASPKIKEIFERWKTADTAALLSNLQKNEELKSVLLQETPWVLQAKSESQQKKNIALLFDLVRMEQQQASSLNKLKQMQSENGGFVWFKGGPDDRYITQYILTGIGHLKKLNALPKNNVMLNQIINAAIPYLDQRVKEDYDALLKSNKGKVPETGGLNDLIIQYLYMRSFFPEKGVPGDLLKAYTYYRKETQKLWLQQGKYFQGMIALSLFRTGDVQAAKNIVASLKQNAIQNEEMGMYWKDISNGYYWYQAPIESQSLLIETFTEVTNDIKAADDMKTWLLKQKQTQNWRTTKATADACYALLLKGTAWLAETPEVTIKLGDYIVRSNEQSAEAGTGYFKKVVDGKNVKPSMGNIEVSIKTRDAQTSGRPSWGAVYWQYFEDLDKITPSSTPLQLSKKLFVEKNTDRGPVLQPVNEGDELKVGDKIKVRIVLKSDRIMEYVHMKDMRAACMEPVNVLSQYKWQGGLGYYETTKDASTSFFFGYLPKGTYVFEYPMFVTHTGTFSNGITNIECMYAPEFSAHSEGVKVNVGN